MRTKLQNFLFQTKKNVIKGQDFPLWSIMIKLWKKISGTTIFLAVSARVMREFRYQHSSFWKQNIFEQKGYVFTERLLQNCFLNISNKVTGKLKGVSWGNLAFVAFLMTSLVKNATVNTNIFLLAKSESNTKIKLCPHSPLIIHRRTLSCHPIVPQT